MTQATLSPELTRQSIALARSLAAAARNWRLYSADHPAVGTSLNRLRETIVQTVAGAAFTFGVRPKTLLVVLKRGVNENLCSHSERADDVVSSK